MKEWGEDECHIVGKSFSLFLIDAQTAEVAVHSWMLHYVQLGVLFDEIDGFETFMLVIVSNLLRDSSFGVMLRVGLGAFLSTMDAIS